MTEEMLNSLRKLVTDGCSDSDLEDFAEENDISVGEVFHQVSIWRAPDCCKGCKNVDFLPNMHPCTRCSRIHNTDMYEAEPNNTIF